MRDLNEKHTVYIRLYTINVHGVFCSNRSTTDESKINKIMYIF